MMLAGSSSQIEDGEDKWAIVRIALVEAHGTDPEGLNDIDQSITTIT